MTTLTEFLEARLAEDEAAAEATSTDYDSITTWSIGRGSTNWHWWVQNNWSDGVVATGSDTSEAAAVVSHIARHDPARVLREVQAKRALLADVEAEKHYTCEDPWYTCKAATEERDGGYYAETDGSGPCDCGRNERVEQRLRFLAAPYTDHPEFRKEWAA